MVLASREGFTLRNAGKVTDRDHCGRLAPANLMNVPSQAEITGLLQAWEKGDRTAEEKLWPIVYSELKRVARFQMRQERQSHTLQSGALVNELYMRLVDWQKARWQNRAHFFGMCARMMRQILVDHAYARGAQKRGSNTQKIALEDVALISESKGAEVLLLDEALKRFTALYPRQSDVIEMRFFGGLSVEETAEVLKISPPTVIRDWSFGRAWLLSYMKGEPLDEA
jgi:RNA polymerase sigma factor (TIGR02999 family)